MDRFRLNYDLNTLRGDVFGGIASGTGAAAGLYGAIAVGFCASVFGGTRVN